MSYDAEGLQKHLNGKVSQLTYGPTKTYLGMAVEVAVSLIHTLEQINKTLQKQNDILSEMTETEMNVVSIKTRVVELDNMIEELLKKGA